MLVIGFTDYLARNNRMLVRGLKSLLLRYKTHYVVIRDAYDRWARDFMPFQRNDGKFIVYKYAPDYLNGKERYITDVDDVTILWHGGKSLGGINDYLGPDLIHTDLKIDGGNLISCVDKNGKNYIIMTDKVFLENGSLKEDDVIEELKTKFKSDFIFLPWDRREPFGHTDGMVRSLGDGKLLIGNFKEDNPFLYETIMNKLTPLFDVYELSFGKNVSENSWCHINYLPLDDAIIVPGIGEKSDIIACEQIEAFTGKRCEILPMGNIVDWGGALNCITWDFKLPQN